mgnify:CR=1 FL=1
MYEFTNKSADVFNVEIDLRYEADGLISEFGIDALYVRNCKFVRCKCFNDLNKTGDPKCPLCFGTGHFASIEKIQTIESSNSAYSGENSLKQTPIGLNDQKNEIYYIRHNKSVLSSTRHPSNSTRPLSPLILKIFVISRT